MVRDARQLSRPEDNKEAVSNGSTVVSDDEDMFQGCYWTGGQIMEKKLPLIDGLGNTIDDVLKQRFGSKVVTQELKQPQGIQALLGEAQAGTSSTAEAMSSNVNSEEIAAGIGRYLEERALWGRYGM